MGSARYIQCDVCAGRGAWVSGEGGVRLGWWLCGEGSQVGLWARTLFGMRNWAL